LFRPEGAYPKERDLTPQRGEIVREEKGRMRNYETIFVVNPTLGEEDYKEVLKKYSTLVERQKGILIRIEEWGVQRLAHAFKRFDKGAFVLMNYCGPSGVTSELERDLKLDDRIFRYQSVKIAEDVDPQELILKEKEKEKRKEPASQQEPAAPAEPAAQDQVNQAEKEVSDHDG
jgi:small subunit ribosomal protein S6